MNIASSASCVLAPVAAAGSAPPVIVIMLAIAPPTKKPFANGWRMLRER